VDLSFVPKHPGFVFFPYSGRGTKFHTHTKQQINISYYEVPLSAVFCTPLLLPLTPKYSHLGLTHPLYIRTAIFCDVTPCSLAESYQHFWEICFTILQTRRVTFYQTVRFHRSEDIAFNGHRCEKISHPESVFHSE
jgi:hypothetical protein